ncbi:Family S60 non peptidase ue S60 family [Fasciola gigantica]|uniref:Family S60 non peptidase ue S60 family n=1 Tax=Fasciola gigantica TaxID=46835 RepID=A0A504Y628_FASGI|nr:Family S60 non peptidase ue S60 family [Fasciola gigantica]
MRTVQSRQADLINLDAGLAHYASTLYSLRPIAVENYAASNAAGARDLFYFANVIVPATSTVDPTNLRGKEICSAGAGTAEGWVAPFGTLIADLKTIPVTQCNSVVQNLIRYLGDSCIPNALNELFNPFGDNTQELCRICYNQGWPTWCTSRDRFARNQGALRCLREYTENIESTVKPVAAFVRAKEIDLAAADGFPTANYKLLCPTKQPNGQWTADLNASSTCHWGQIPSRMIMTPLTQPNVTLFTTFLTTMVNYFGPAGTHSAIFSLFQSTGYGETGSSVQTHNLMFSDLTRNIYVPPDEETATYYRWTNATFLEALKKLDQCPLPTMGWCVIDEFEMDKCQRMSSAFGARSIKPDLTCIQADSVLDCMRLIQDGYADMVTLEAGDLYAAGKYFGLVPIVADSTVHLNTGWGKTEKRERIT